MLTKKISNWMIAAAIILGVAALTPNNVAAQGGIFICATCDSITGSCDVRLGEPINDVCISGTWRGRGWCVSHGRQWCDPRVVFDDVGADGALLRERTFASSESQGRETWDSQTEHVRDCRSRIVARSYGSDEAEDMRRRTESIVI